MATRSRLNEDALAGTSPAMPERTTQQRQFQQALRDHGVEQELKRLKRPSASRLAGSLLLDWSVILMAFLSCVCLSWWLLPLALVLIANRQMALNNMLHDASHKNLTRRAWVNDLIGEWLCALPCLTTLSRYRREHVAHHRFLGDPADDPDFIAASGSLSWQRQWASLTAESRRFLRSLLGTTLSMGSVELLCLLAWWLAAILLLAVPLGWGGAVEFPALWLLARGAVFHPLMMFREMADHYGLDPENWLGSTRNVEGSWLLAELIHPHQDGYHLLHHLVPSVPFYHSRAAHRLLLRVPAYAGLHHCDGYFCGSHSLCRCLTGGCPGCRHHGEPCSEENHVSAND